MNAELFTDEPLPQTDLFSDEPAPEEKSLAGFGKNLWEDVKGTAVGVGGLAKGLMTEPVETVTNFATGIGPALFEEGKRIGVGKLLTGHPIKAASQFGEAMYEKPLTTTLDVLPAAGAAGKALGVGGKAARGAKLAAEAGEAAELAKGAELAGAAAKVSPMEAAAKFATEKFGKPAPAKMAEVYAAPLREFAAPFEETSQLLKDPKYLNWEKTIKEIPEVYEAKPTVGVFEGKTEPSAVFQVPIENVDYVAGKIGSGLGKAGEKWGAPQKAVGISNEFSTTPNGTKYSIVFKTPELLKKWHGKTREFGLDYHTADINNNTMILLDQGDSLGANIDRMVMAAKKEGDIHGLSRFNSEIKFPGEADYPGLVERGTRPPLGGTQETGGAAAGGDIRLGGAYQGPAAPGVTPPEIPPAPWAKTQEAITQLKGKIPPVVKEPIKEVGEYLKTKYSQAAEKPGMGETFGKYFKQHARNMAMKATGAAPGQIRKIGLKQAEKLADYLLDKKLVSSGVGDIGRAEKIMKMNQEAGQVVGDIRALTANRGAAHNMPALIEEIKAKVLPQYSAGVKSGEASQVVKALEEIQMSGATPDKVAQTITNLFQESKKMDRLKQPSGAYADVARELRRANEDLMSQYLKPDELKAYHNALEEYGATTQIKEFIKRKESMEMGGRLGPGSGISRMMVQKAFDTVGYRTEAQIANRMAKWFKANPKLPASPKDIFRKYVDEAAEAVDEMINPLE